MRTGRAGVSKYSFEAHRTLSNPIPIAGNPSPRLTWWREHALIDDSYEVLNGATVNALRIPAVRNTDLNAVFVCQAVNNNMSFPVSTSLRMDISCKLSPPSSLAFGRKCMYCTQARKFSQMRIFLVRKAIHIRPKFCI